MKKQTQHLLTAVIVLLIIITTFIPANLVSGQSVPPIYFPIFMYNEDPNYAFGLDGGTVVILNIDPTDPDTIYAGTWGNGIYKSEDGGLTWTHIINGLRSPYIYEIAIDPFDSQHLLASVYTFGVDQSFDGGETWEDTSGFPPYAVSYSIDFDPTDSQIVYTAIRTATQGSVYPGGVWKSINGGISWGEVTSTSNGFYEEDYIYDLAIDPRDPRIVYTANHRTGVYRTTDAGVTWKKVSSGLVHQDIRDIQVNPVNGRVYAGIWDGYGFAYSDNGGSSWTNNSWSNGADLYVFEIQYDPEQPNNIYLTTANGVYSCLNPSAGSTCNVITSSGQFVWDLALDDHGAPASNGRTNTMYTAIQHFGVRKSVNGGVVFDPSYKGIDANIVHSVMVNPADPNIQFVSAHNRGLFRTLDGGTVWKSLYYTSGLKFINDIAARPGSVEAVYVGDTYGGIQFSLDNGDSWISGNSGLSRSVEDEVNMTSSGGGIDINSYGGMDPVDLQDLIDALGVMTTDRASVLNVETIGIDPDDSAKMFAGRIGGGVVYSNNGGISWSGSKLSSVNVLDSMVDTSQTQKYLVGLENGGVKVSADRINWVDLNAGWSGRDVFALAMESPGVYLAGTDTGVYRIDRNGSNSWVSLGLSTASVQDLVVDPTDSNMIWAATLSGLYYGVPSGETYVWTQFDLADSNNDRMFVIEVIPGATREFYIGMDGGGLYHFPQPGDLLP